MCGCAAVIAGGLLPPAALPRRFHRRRRGTSVRVQASPGGESQRKKVAVAGAGWAGLAAAHHLVKQGYDVTLLGAESGPTEEVGLRANFVNLNVIKTVVNFQVEFPIFHNQPRLPAPFGVFAYPQFPNLPLVDRLTSIPVIAAVTARELFKMYGCSQRLYKEVFEPAIQAALFAPVYSYKLFPYCKENSDFLLCRGEVEEKIYSPWLKSLELKGLKFVANKIPTSMTIDKDNGCISSIICGEDIYEADAFVSAMGLSPLQSIIMNSSFLRSDQEFANLLRLSTIDVISVRLWFDKKITIPNVANVCSGFDDSSGLTFFDLTSVYDDYYGEPITIVEAQFYNASHLLPLSDEHIISEVSSRLIKCIQDFDGATAVIQHSVRRAPRSVINYLPGSYKYILRGSTSFPNLFLAGDWIVNRHGSFSKEKAYVTGLEAANRVVDYFGNGDFAKIIAVEGDEPHIETLRSLNRRANELKPQTPFSEFFLQ
ncbi:hypothetical protein PR202_ga19398 [Eleusine coracana subsp. coracana]|uniref:Amine oxidase domain-containing protein n=1 Tax=Eleusine coracana subsp. coracana TaxID=191504 RepID=A0AAV5CWC0_ELECO|nr:hypothetical protein PR202_ga19398 [Eleusine coracana subsp. coracana]